MAFWDYVLRCSDGSCYTGHTDNIQKRVAVHQADIIQCYTSTRRPVQFVFEQHFPTRDEALAAERQIKGCSRKKKQALIRGDWKEIQRLSWGTRNPLPDRLK
jgi:putative endonuclease